MPVSRSSINSFTRALKSVDSSTVWTPRPGRWSLEQGLIVGTDVGNNVASIQLNGGGDPIAAGVRYVQAYTADNPPVEGEAAWFHYNGRVALLLGRHVVPNGAVIL